jgi:threonine dehydrogenase-like Zn-dependent dehydrogenase
MKAHQLTEETSQPVIPGRMRALMLGGTGFERLEVREVATPRPGPNQLLARVDAAGICTSLIKLIEQGPAHQFVAGWDLERFPLILGDEGALTLVEIGENLTVRYRVGQRFGVQPAVAHPPINHRERYRDGARGIGKVAVGYTLGGCLAEYLLIQEEVLAAQCLIPLPDPALPFAHAALAEPVSCCVSAQDHHMHLAQPDPLAPREARKGLRPGGVTVIIGAGAMGRMHVDVALSQRPRALICADFIESRLEVVRRLFGARAQALGIELHTPNAGQTDVSQLVDRLTNARGADDVIVAVGSPKAIESAQALVGWGGVLNLFGGLKKGEETVGLDTSRIHYREINVTGSSGGSPWDVAHTLALMARGELDAGAHIAAIGDLAHAPLFLDWVRAQRLDGKAVVYPHRHADAVTHTASWSAEDEREYLKG